MERKPVFVVDDNIDTLDMLDVLLTHAGYTVRTASAGAELVKLLQDGIEPSAIIMDLGLPDASGVSLCRTIRNTQRGSRLPIIAFTGWSSGSARDGLEEATFNEIFLKPVDPRVLLEALIRWVERPTPLSVDQSPVRASELPNVAAAPPIPPHSVAQ